MQDPSSNEECMQGRCIPGCVENVWGQILYRQLVSNSIIANLADVAVALAKRRLLKLHVPFEPHAVR